MSLRPTEYYISIVTWGLDSEPEISYIDMRSLEDAKAYIEGLDVYASIIHRKNIRDVTPREDGRGLLWDFEEELIAEN